MASIFHTIFQLNTLSYNFSSKFTFLIKKYNAGTVKVEKVIAVSCINRLYKVRPLGKIGKYNLRCRKLFLDPLIANDVREIMNFQLTTGKVNSRYPIENLYKNLRGKVFSDKGYLSKDLFEKLMEQGMELITQVRNWRIFLNTMIIIVFNFLDQKNR